MANKRRFIRLKMTEFDEQFSDEMAEDIQVSILVMCVVGTGFISSLIQNPLENLTISPIGLMEKSNIAFYLTFLTD